MLRSLLVICTLPVGPTAVAAVDLSGFVQDDGWTVTGTVSEGGALLAWRPNREEIMRAVAGQQGSREMPGSPFEGPDVALFVPPGAEWPAAVGSLEPADREGWTAITWDAPAAAQPTFNALVPDAFVSSATALVPRTLVWIGDPLAEPRVVRIDGELEADFPFTPRELSRLGAFLAAASSARDVGEAMAAMVRYKCDGVVVEGPSEWVLVDQSSVTEDDFRPPGVDPETGRFARPGPLFRRNDEFRVGDPVCMYTRRVIEYRPRWDAWPDTAWVTSVTTEQRFAPAADGECPPSLPE
jgi:hypothetical protein